MKCGQNAKCGPNAVSAHESEAGASVAGPYDGFHLVLLIQYQMVHLAVLSSPEIDFDVEEYERDEGRDAEKEGLAEVHVVLDVDRVVPGKNARYTRVTFYQPTGN